MAQQSAARRAERAAARAAEAEAEEDYDEAEDEYRDEEDAEEEMETPAFRIGVPDWLNGIRHWGHKVTEEMEAEEPEAARSRSRPQILPASRLPSRSLPPRPSRRCRYGYPGPGLPLT